jgi:hypothetical protein
MASNSGRCSSNKIADHVGVEQVERRHLEEISLNGVRNLTLEIKIGRTEGIPSIE